MLFETIQETHSRLCTCTKHCRDDMHEPDEQLLSAVFTGYRFDNAQGVIIDSMGWSSPNGHEMAVGLRDGLTERIEWFNLCDLIALARRAVFKKNEVICMVRSIVIDGHTLGVICPDKKTIQILKASVLRGSPFPSSGVLAFNPQMTGGRYREATEKDFQEFGVVSSPLYFETVEVAV